MAHLQEPEEAPKEQPGRSDERPQYAHVPGSSSESEESLEIEKMDRKIEMEQFTLSRSEGPVSIRNGILLKVQKKGEFEFLHPQNSKTQADLDHGTSIFRRSITVHSLDMHGTFGPVHSLQVPAIGKS